jgi:hypothetical protein
MQQPNPLQLPAEEQLDLQNMVDVSRRFPQLLAKVHGHVIKYCCDHNLTEMLYYYTDFWK